MARKKPPTIAEVRERAQAMALGDLVDALFAHRQAQMEAARSEDWVEHGAQRRTAEVYRDELNSRDGPKRNRPLT